MLLLAILLVLMLIPASTTVQSENDLQRFTPRNPFELATDYYPTSCTETVGQIDFWEALMDRNTNTYSPWSEEEDYIWSDLECFGSWLPTGWSEAPYCGRTDWAHYDNEKACIVHQYEGPDGAGFSESLDRDIRDAGAKRGFLISRTYTPFLGTEWSDIVRVRLQFSITGSWRAPSFCYLYVYDDGGNWDYIMSITSPNNKIVWSSTSGQYRHGNLKFRWLASMSEGSAIYLDAVSVQLHSSGYHFDATIHWTNAYPTEKYLYLDYHSSGDNPNEDLKVYAWDWNGDEWDYLAITYSWGFSYTLSSSHFSYGQARIRFISESISGDSTETEWRIAELYML